MAGQPPPVMDTRRSGHQPQVTTAISGIYVYQIWQSPAAWRSPLRLSVLHTRILICTKLRVANCCPDEYSFMVIENIKLVNGLCQAFDIYKTYYKQMSAYNKRHHYVWSRHSGRHYVGTDRRGDTAPRIFIGEELREIVSRSAPCVARDLIRGSD